MMFITSINEDDCGSHPIQMSKLTNDRLYRVLCLSWYEELEIEDKWDLQNIPQINKLMNGIDYYCVSLP